LKCFQPTTSYAVLPSVYAEPALLCLSLQFVIFKQFCQQASQGNVHVTVIMFMLKEIGFF
jgi:hypothetical protein